MHPVLPLRGRWSALVLLAAWAGACAPLRAQTAAGAGGEGGPIVADSTVGYIDNAIPGNMLRLRFDAGYNMPTANRGEFFYQRSSQAPGDQVETNVDYQEISLYGEFLINQRFSVFAEVPFRLINPEVDVNARGIGDCNFGFKYAFVHDEGRTLTFQLRTYVPTGNGVLGLGNSHVVAEPALLGYQKLSDRLAAEGELRFWAPLNNTQQVPGAVSGGSANFQSDVIRYGVGLEYKVWENCRFSVVPVVEVVGWTFLNGKETVQQPFPSGTDISAAGDTIVNVKLGTRFKVRDRGDLYVGYGRALTGDTFYKNILRAELRWVF